MAPHKGSNDYCLLFLNLFLQHKRLELKIREMESKLDLEKTTKTRMETMIQRMKEVVEKMTREMDDLRMRELSGQDEVKKMSRQLR